MHISRVDLNLFVVLDAICSEGNITRAAKSLNLTQPALSHALSRLRRLFADPLFTRQGNLMMPTPLTRSLIGPVRQSLKTLAATVQQAQSFDPMASARTFHIGLRDVLEAKLLPGLIRRVRAETASVAIVSARVDRPDVEGELAAGSLDMAVDVLLQTSREIRRRRLLGDRPVVLMRAGHPIAARRLDLDTYLAQGHVLVSSRRQGVGLEDMALARIDRHRSIALRCQHYFAACQVVGETDLLLTMPEHYARMAAAGRPILSQPLPIDMPPIDIYLYWHENADRDPANLWLRTLLMEVAGAG
jgi:DNA-binding transcriptional LysR family regulator